MKFSSSVPQYLTGELFSNGLSVPISEPESNIPNRLQILEELVTGKAILHMGCVDHIPLIEKKIRENQWLHARLDASASRCLGVDINAEGIRYLQENLGYKDVIHANLLVDDPVEIHQRHWDFMIMGEILEHLDEPVSFLRALHERYTGIIDRLVLTVPNAFALANFFNALHHQEIINTDHRFWFTPFTLAKVAMKAGMQVNSFRFCESTSPAPTTYKGRPAIRPIIRNTFLKKYPAFRDTLVMEVVL